MTWTKLGDEFGPESADLTDGEFRIHVEALIWSSWRLLDLYVPKADVLRFARSADPDADIGGLVAKGWWQDAGPSWFVGVRFAEWQLGRVQVEARRAYLAEAQRRSREHKAGNHSLCLPSAKCRSESTVESTVDSTVDPGRDGTGRESAVRPKVNSKPAPSPESGDGPNQVVHDDQQNRDGVLADASVTTVTRASGDDNGQVRPGFDYFGGQP